MRIITFNVNSLAKRLDALLDFLDERKVDVALLQELKCPPERFPLQAIEQAGWHAAFVAEKAYNGVAVLSRDSALSVRRSALPPLQQKGQEKEQEKEQEDAQARYLEVATHGLVVASLYAPNGNPLVNPSDENENENAGGGEKFRYKIAWMERLCRHVEEELLIEGRPFLLGGDFNVCPQAHDLFDEQALEGDALIHTKSRQGYRRIIYSGLVDAFRAPSNPQHRQKGYTYWDYRRSRFQRDEGLRIDMMMLSPALSEKIETCFVERSLRAHDQPSDHTPLCLDLVWDKPQFQPQPQYQPQSQPQSQLLASSDTKPATPLASDKAKPLQSRLVI